MSKTLKADAADAHMVAHQAEQGASPEAREAMKEWSPTLGKRDESNRPAAKVGVNPEKMSKEERISVIKTKNESLIPNYPSIEFEASGRTITYVDGQRREDYIEQRIFFRTVGSKDINTVERYRSEKAYAVVAYHNFPPAAHPAFVEFAKLKELLDAYIDPVEARKARARERE